MSRPLASVRRVTAELEHPFVELWMESLVENGVSPEVASRAASEGKVSAVLARPDVRAYLAMSDDQPVGFVVLTQCPFSGLVDAPTVAIDQLFVTKGSRHHGVARQLLLTATLYAEQLGCEQVVSNVPSHHRDANRFFARLGFSAQVVRRVVGTSALRRRLAVGDDSRGSLEQVLHQRRRSLRARTKRARQLVS